MENASGHPKVKSFIMTTAFVVFGLSTGEYFRYRELLECLLPVALRLRFSGEGWDLPESGPTFYEFDCVFLLGLLMFLYGRSRVPKPVGGDSIENRLGITPPNVDGRSKTDIVCDDQ